MTTLHLKKLLTGSFMVALLAFPGLTLAGGSSMLVRVEGKNMTAEADDILPAALNLHLETYFQRINHLRLDNITVACQEKDNILSKIDLISGSQLLNSENFSFSSQDGLSTVHFRDIPLQNNSTYDFGFNISVSDHVALPQLISCSIRNITVRDLDQNEIIFSGMRTQDYVFVEKNEPAFISYEGNF